MTGFGRSELRTPYGFIRVELKTTNHKFLEVSSKLPPHVSEFEDPIRRAISEKIRRGKVYLFVHTPDPSAFTSRLMLNEALAREVAKKIRQLRTVLSLEAPIQERELWREVLRYPDVLTKDQSRRDDSTFSKDLFKALAQALEKLERSRAQEGRALGRDLEQRGSQIRQALTAIERRLPRLAKEYAKRLRERASEFLKNGEVDRDRLTQEVAQYLKNSDIAEEITRLKSHLDSLRRTLGETGEIGRKIDFIGQEMIREANTIGSKSSDVDLAERVIQIKSAIERIREQAQNLE